MRHTGTIFLSLLIRVQGLHLVTPAFLMPGISLLSLCKGFHALNVS